MNFVTHKNHPRQSETEREKIQFRGQSKNGKIKWSKIDYTPKQQNKKFNNVFCFRIRAMWTYLKGVAYGAPVEEHLMALLEHRSCYLLYFNFLYISFFFAVGKESIKEILKARCIQILLNVANKLNGVIVNQFVGEARSLLWNCSNIRQPSSILAIKLLNEVIKTAPLLISQIVYSEIYNAIDYQYK